MDWTDIRIIVDADNLDEAGDIAQMASSQGIYIEDYRDVENDIYAIARVGLIDEELLGKDRSKGIIHIYLSPEENPESVIAFLAERFAAEGMALRAETVPCKNEDWENNWKAYFKPFPVGKKLFIRPVWEEAECPEGRTVLNIEPGLAFGNGSHETTSLCLEALEDLVKTSSRVLDVGCGSGILSVAALLLGAASAVGIDIDKAAVKTAVENGRLNGFCESRYRVVHGNLADEANGFFDLIVANIAADSVNCLCGSVSSLLSPGGVFVSSGIIDTREPDVLEAFGRNGLKVSRRRENNGWLCFECRPASSVTPAEGP